MSREMNNDINNWIAVMYVAHMTASPIKEYISNYARYIKYFLKYHNDKILFNHAILNNQIQILVNTMFSIET